MTVRYLHPASKRLPKQLLTIATHAGFDCLARMMLAWFSGLHADDMYSDTCMSKCAFRLDVHKVHAAGMHTHTSVHLLV